VFFSPYCFFKATEAFQSGDLDTAAKLFVKLDDLVGHVLPLGLTNLAVVYTQANKHNKALKTYKKLAKRFPNDASVIFQYCRFGVNVVNMKRPAVKIEKSLLETVCMKSLEMNSADPEAAMLLGSFYVLMMDFAKSWPVLELAVDMSAGEAKHRAVHQQALTNLALSNLRGARPEEALKHSRKLYVSTSISPNAHSHTLGRSSKQLHVPAAIPLIAFQHPPTLFC
jgi:tetratricopeptide (TPR) repeat protein